MHISRVNDPGHFNLAYYSGRGQCGTIKPDLLPDRARESVYPEYY